VDERIDTTACGGLGNCNGDKRCITHQLWQDLSNSIHDYLSGISLQELVDRARQAEAAQQVPVGWVEGGKSGSIADP